MSKKKHSEETNRTDLKNWGCKLSTAASGEGRGPRAFAGSHESEALAHLGVPDQLTLQSNSSRESERLRPSKAAEATRPNRSAHNALRQPKPAGITRIQSESPAQIISPLRTKESCVTSAMENERGVVGEL